MNAQFIKNKTKNSVSKARHAANVRWHGKDYKNKISKRRCKKSIKKSSINR